MPQIFYYLIKVIICSGILFGYYHLFLRNKIYHVYNRFYLLASILLSLTIPLMNFNIHTKNKVETEPIQLLQAVNSSDEYLEEIIIYSHKNNISASAIIFFCYSIVSMILLMFFIQMLWHLYLMINRNKKQNFDQIVFIKSNERGTPFSFFKYLFWNDAIDITSETGRQVFAHELAHIKEKHSIDKLMINILLLFFWVNPIFWLIKKELNLIHEFIADKKAVGNEETHVLAAMIIHSAYPKHHFLLINHFFYSPIKRRLHMLSKYKSSKAGYFTRILALPVILFLAAAFTLKTKKIMEPLFNNSKQITVVIDAGHGGNDAGAISPSGLVEKELNLLLAKKIKDLNINDNIKIILTRQSDLTQSPQDKVAIAAQSGADLFISIHLNNGPKDSENKNTGLEVYVAKDEYPLSNKSKLFATAVIYAFSDNYKLPVLANPLQRKTGIWILQSNVCPSVIIEAGYLNNVSDMAYLQTESGKETFAKNVLAALNNYFSQTEIGLTSSTEVMNALSQLRPTTHLTKDTIPKLIKNNEVILIDNVEMVIKRDGEKQELSVIVIDDKIYNYEEIKNKTIIAKRARLYGKNNKEMIDLYGLQARDGAMVFEDAIITDNLSGIYTNALKDVKNNPYVDASERINGKSQRIIFESNELIIQDGKEITKKEMGAIDKNRIRTINVYKEKQAIEKFGNKGRNGVLEIATIDTLIKPASQKPYITLSGISGPRIHIDQLKNIKELTLSSPEYRIIRGTAFFAGAGFPNVNTADFAGSSLIPLQTLLNRILPGTSVTFDNIQIEQKDGKGRMTINGKSFGFYKNESDIIMNNDDKIFTEVEVDPQFPGGISGWQNYLKTHINPMLPVDEGWKAGTYQITVLFIVDKDGNISDVNTKDFTNSKTALHCIDLIKKGPRWIPAKQNGVSVKAYKKQPITFVVSEG